MAGVYGKGHLGVSFLRGSMLAEGMGKLDYERGDGYGPRNKEIHIVGCVDKVTIGAIIDGFWMRWGAHLLLN